MKKITYLLTAFLILGISSCQCPKSSDQTTPNLIRTAIPERPAGQTDVIGLRCAPLDTVRVGFIGLGMRGPGAVYRFTQIEGTAIKALCDLYPERVEKAQEILTKNNRPQAAAYSGEEGWKQLCERPDIDLVYIVTPWLLHTPIAVYAMEHGKHVAIEVPAAMNLDECWQLINTSEKTRKHCMMLENCVYDFFELTTLNMAQHGLFGDILHVEGSYIHNLEEFWAAYQGNWRLDFNEKYRGDVYATHGMGPACQLLDIHRGNKMNYLVSMDTKALTGPKLVEKINKRDGKDFQNGDHTMTMIMTENGQTMHIQHDVMNPRPYSRMYQLTGTEGFANKYPVEGYALDADQLSASGIQPKVDDLNSHGFLPETEMETLVEKYQHPILKKYGEMAKEVGGHGGMDFVMDSRLVYCLQNGLPLDMDVYDLAEWCCLAELGELSMDNGCAAVAFPDFTRGEWNVVKGYKHAYATPEEEAAAMEKAKAFTAKLKEQGAKEWAEK